MVDFAQVKAKTKKPLKHKPTNPKERAAAFVAQQVANIEGLLAASKAEHGGAAGMDDVWPAPLQTQEVVAAKRAAARAPERPEVRLRARWVTLRALAG